MRHTPLYTSLSLALCLLLPCASKAQDRFEASAKVGIVSQYMWRGLDLADISLQPEATIAWKGLSLNVSASTGFDHEDMQDIDVTLEYSRWGFNIGLTDYWERGVDPRNRYFYYGGGYECPHQLEVNLGYSCKYGSIQANTMILGNDYKTDGCRAYSTFIELSIPFRALSLDWEANVGITPFESAGANLEVDDLDDDGKPVTTIRREWMYGEKFSCNMLSLRATKDIKFKYFRMPVFVEFYTNPYLQTFNLVGGIAVATL